MREGRTREREGRAEGEEGSREEKAKESYKNELKEAEEVESQGRGEYLGENEGW